MSKGPRTCQLMTDFQGSCQVLCTLGGLGRACSNEVVQIMKEIWDLVGGNKDPFHHVCNGVENKWGQSKTEGENQVHVELVAPLHPQQNAVRRVNRHIAVGCLHIKFGHEGPWTQFGNLADNLIHCDVMEGELMRVYPVVDASPPPPPERKGPR